MDLYRPLLEEEAANEIERLLAELDEARAEIARLRAYFDRRHSKDLLYDEDQDLLVELGILVEAPADEAFREEWGEDTMLVLRWHIEPEEE
jgi:hypothetical protein